MFEGHVDEVIDEDLVDLQGIDTRSNSWRWWGDKDCGFESLVKHYYFRHEADNFNQTNVSEDNDVPFPEGECTDDENHMTDRNADGYGPDWSIERIATGLSCEACRKTVPEKEACVKEAGISRYNVHDLPHRPMLEPYRIYLVWEINYCVVEQKGDPCNCPFDNGLNAVI